MQNICQWQICSIEKNLIVIATSESTRLPLSRLPTLFYKDLLVFFIFCICPAAYICCMLLYAKQFSPLSYCALRPDRAPGRCIGYEQSVWDAGRGVEGASWSPAGLTGAEAEGQARHWRAQELADRQRAQPEAGTDRLPLQTWGGTCPGSGEQGKGLGPSIMHVLWPFFCFWSPGIYFNLCPFIKEIFIKKIFS